PGRLGRRRLVHADGVQGDGVPVEDHVGVFRGDRLRGVAGHADAAGETRVEGDGARDRAEGGPAEHDAVRPAARPGAGDDVGDVVAVGVDRRHAHAAAEVRVVGEEAGPRGAPLAAEHLDVRAAAGPGPRDDLGAAVLVEVPGGDVDAAGEGRGVGQEAGDRCRIDAAERLHVRSAAGAGAGDDVGVLVAVDVADGDVDAAAEALVVGE